MGPFVFGGKLHRRKQTEHRQHWNIFDHDARLRPTAPRRHHFAGRAPS
jgi:hypothetical protein